MWAEEFAPRGRCLRGDAVTEQRVQRRLAAILAADVVGYAALMQRAEEATYAEFERLMRDLIEPGLSRHDGRLIKMTGDGALAEFASPLAGVKCAIEIQDRLASGGSPLQLRMGLNLGDVIVGPDGDLYGDGINIAVRLEGVADPGGILISEKVYSEIEGKLDVGFEDRGQQQLKNISKPVRAYAVRAGKHNVASERASPAPAIPDKPSIAVLPFQNMSGDPEQEYFADGMVEEITTALSRFHWLFVIARTSTFSYKGRGVDVKQVGRELGVRYLLEGSVRKSGNRVRITGQLIDATTGAHLWADHFDGSLENIFELQDQVASGVVGALDPKLLDAEMARVKRKAPTDLNAYDLFLRASDHIYRWTVESHEEALRLLYQAIELDPEYAQAYAFATYCYIWRITIGRIDAEQFVELRRLAREAIKFGRDDGFSLAWGGFGLACASRTTVELKEGAAFIDQALLLNPNLARSWNLSGWVRGWLDEPDIAIEHLARAMRLSPLDFAFHAMEAAMAYAHMRANRYHDAIVWAEKSLRHQPNNVDALAALATACELIGETDRAQTAMKRLLQLAPNRKISNFFAPHVSPERRALVGDALRRAGMPE
jgi:adenylate cyclase